MKDFKNYLEDAWIEATDTEKVGLWNEYAHTNTDVENILPNTEVSVNDYFGNCNPYEVISEIESSEEYRTDEAWMYIGPDGYIASTDDPDDVIEFDELAKWAEGRERTLRNCGSIFANMLDLIQEDEQIWNELIQEITINLMETDYYLTVEQKKELARADELLSDEIIIDAVNRAIEFVLDNKDMDLYDIDDQELFSAVKNNIEDNY